MRPRTAGAPKEGPGDCLPQRCLPGEALNKSRNELTRGSGGVTDSGQRERRECECAGVGQEEEGQAGGLPHSTGARWQRGRPCERAVRLWVWMLPQAQLQAVGGFYRRGDPVQFDAEQAWAGTHRPFIPQGSQAVSHMVGTRSELLDLAVPTLGLQDQKATAHSTHLSLNVSKLFAQESF